MARFYLAQDLYINTSIELPSEVVRHIHVLRLRIGEEIELFNGNGFAYIATITHIEKRNVIALINFEIESHNESQLKLTLAMCLIANDKMDFTIQKATELGVNSIVPIISERSQRIDKERLAKRLEHWNRIVINSCEQSRRNIIPKIDLPMDINKFLVIQNSIHTKIILSPHAKPITSLPESCNEVIVLVGPEGGFSPNEINLANLNGYISQVMGKRILRAETAAISALAFCQIHYGDF